MLLTTLLPSHTDSPYSNITIFIPTYFFLVHLLLGVVLIFLIKLTGKQWPSDGCFMLFKIQLCQALMSVTAQSPTAVSGSPASKPLGPDTAEFYRTQVEHLQKESVVYR